MFTYIIILFHFLFQLQLKYFTITETENGKPLDLTEFVPDKSLVNVIVEELQSSQEYQWRMNNNRLEYSEQFHGLFMPNW